MIKHPDLWHNSTLIYLRAKDEDELDIWKRRFVECNIPFASFQEPDINNQSTAVAVISNPDSDSMLKNIRLV
jgi:hypothetical protein